MTEATDHARLAVSAALDQVKAERAALEKAVAALSRASQRPDGRRAGANGSAPPRRPTLPRKRRRRPSEETKGALLAVIAAHPGLTLSAIARESGISYTYARKLTLELAADGRARRSGDGWHAAANA